MLLGNMKINQKLFFGFMIMVSLLVLTGYVGFNSARTINIHLSSIFENDMQGMDFLLEADRDLHQLLVAERSMIFANTQSEVFQGLVAEYEENLAQSMERWNKYKALEHTETEKALFPKFEQAREEWLQVTRQIVEGRKADTRDGRRLALDFSLGEGKEKFEIMRGYIDQLTGISLEQATADEKNSVTTFKRMVIILLAVTGIGVITGIIITWLLTVNIAKPLKKAADLAETVKLGDLSKRLDTKSNDEVGQLFKALNNMADGLEEKAKLAGKIAAGNLTAEVPLASEKDVLGTALRKMTKSLNELLSEINASADQMASGANQVSGASQTLSQGATEQATSLEEVTSSIAELASQTRVNAENATQASEQSIQVRKMAEEGNRQMQGMGIAMDEINQAGQNISKIIKVIDEIAFQTNLLALNAAVEAARAGKHGRGFAVVAEEVRNLAARSAKAAKETSVLIEGSVQKTANGNEIAKQTTAALGEIVKGVIQFADLVENIAAKSNEQAQGINQINEGLGQIGEVTQQNSANAEQSAAASEELSAQAEQLRIMLSNFKLQKQYYRQRHPVLEQPQLTPPEPEEDGADKKKKFAKLPPVAKDNFPKNFIVLDDREFGKY